MNCPRCGHPSGAETACPRCGVVFAKLSAPRARAPLLSPPRVPAAERSTRRVQLALWALLILVLAAGGLRAVRPSTSPALPASPEAAVVEDRIPEMSPPAAAPTPLPITGLPVAESGFASEDRVLADDLVNRVNSRSPISEADIRSAEALLSRHPDEPGLQELLGAVLLAAGSGEAQARRLQPALTHLRRSIGLLPDSREPRLGVLGVLYELGDWAGAEAAAREILALDPRNPDVLERLAYSLFRQDNNREALEVVQQALELRPTPFSRSLLDRIRKAMADERGMTEQQISHFHVRYDGDAHEDVGREILGSLERHYATLVATLDHRPAATIPVILFSRQQYYDASGAPAWSGGVYDGIDGRIRIPIGGLSASLGPDMDRTLIHEVTHAFIADRTRGQCPRDIHEGMAQYMEGKRLADELTANQITALADGRIPGVAGFYLQALSFVEFLMGSRGQGGVNDLLRAMGESGDVDEAFQQVYGSDHRATRQAWLARLRQQHGS